MGLRTWLRNDPALVGLLPTRQEADARRLYRKDPAARAELAALKKTADETWVHDAAGAAEYRRREAEIIAKYRRTS